MWGFVNEIVMISGQCPRTWVLILFDYSLLPIFSATCVYDIPEAVYLPLLEVQ
jgi:hypothetical protein